MELPEAGSSEAVVVWARELMFGCAFVAPIPRAAVSAALLRSPGDAPAPVPRPLAEQVLRPHESPPADPYPFAESTFTRAVAIASLLLALIAAAVFVFALLAFPFTT